MSVANSHIRVCGSLILIGGNPGAYLDALRDAKSRLSTYAPDRIERRREKIDFADFVTKAGGRSPKTVALIGNASVLESAFAAGEPVGTFLKQLPEGQYFCKPNKGRNGIGAFRLAVRPDGLLADDEERSLADVATTLSSEDYVVQEWIAPLQHPDIARFRGGVINTMRLVTFDTDDGAKPVAGSLRMAISLKSIDSWTQGGVVAAIDLDTRPQEGPEDRRSPSGIGVGFSRSAHPTFSSGGRDRVQPAWQIGRGKVTRLGYRLGAGRTVLS